MRCPADDARCNKYIVLNCTHQEERKYTIIMIQFESKKLLITRMIMYTIRRIYSSVIDYSLLCVPGTHLHIYHNIRYKKKKKGLPYVRVVGWFTHRLASKPPAMSSGTVMTPPTMARACCGAAIQKVNVETMHAGVCGAC